MKEDNEEGGAGIAAAVPEFPGERADTVGVVGLGYTGLPAAVAFGRHGPTIGYDASAARVGTLMRGGDTTGAVSARALAQARHLWITQDPKQLARADYVLVAVPTLADAQRPDLSSLEAATRTIGHHLKPGATVIFASTVYPGATEDVCVPLLELATGWRWRRDFHVAYSPERAGAGEDALGSPAIARLVAADDAGTLDRVAALFEAVAPAGVRRMSSIRAAEAAQLVHGVQRDLGIALVNEMAIVFDRLDLDTTEVLRAAETKWSCAPLRPGLPGGHAISVAPYCLAHAARGVQWHPELIVGGRRINDAMPAHIAARTARVLARAGRNVDGARINVLGLAYKENCGAVRHSRAVELVRELRRLGAHCCVHDPVVDPIDVRGQCGLKLHDWDELPRADALVLAVAHRKLVDLPPAALLQKIARNGCLVDVKSALDPEPFRRADINVWRL